MFSTFNGSINNSKAATVTSSLKAKLRIVTAVCLFSILIGCTLLFLGNVWVWQVTKNQILNLESIPDTYQVGIILGAKVYSDGRLSGMTQDRCDRAVQLYQQKKIGKVLVSGDHGRQNYDEVNAIRHCLLDNHIPPHDIFLDHAGFDTYDSIYRAQAVFQAQSAIVITQHFHLPRALFIAQRLGLTAVGVPADIRDYGHMERVIIREKVAVMKAWFNILTHTQPQFLGDPIPLTGDSKASWDEDK